MVTLSKLTSFPIALVIFAPRRDGKLEHFSSELDGQVPCWSISCVAFESALFGILWHRNNNNRYIFASKSTLVFGANFLISVFIYIVDFTGTLTVVQHGLAET